MPYTVQKIEEIKEQMLLQKHTEDFDQENTIYINMKKGTV